MSDEELAKDLGLLSALTIGIGTMIGAGIFVLPGIAAQEAGPIVVLSFAIGGCIALINALCISELATAMPKAGGGYYYVNRGLGPLFGSIAGLGDWMGLAFASAFYCIGFGGYLAGAFGDVTFVLPLLGTVHLIPELDLLLFTLNQTQVGALVAGVLFVGVNYIGAKETGGLQTVIVLILLGILTVFAFAGFFYFDYSVLVVDGWAPTEMGYGAVLPATALVFVSFLGYAKIATVGEEMKNPGRNLPIALVGSVVIVTLIYVALMLVMLGVVPWDELSDRIPVSQVAGVTLTPVMGGVGVGLMTFAALLATASSANASILSSARINFAMGRDRVVTDWLNEIHPRFATPYRSILVTGFLIVVFIAALGERLDVLSRAASVLHLIVYGLMNIALITFREADVEGYSPDFRVPLYPYMPIAGTVFSFGLIAFMASTAQLLSALFVVGAVAWYFFYGRKNAKVEGVLSDVILKKGDDVHPLAVSAAEAVKPEGEYRVMVPVANPATQEGLVRMGATLAEANDGRLVVVHVATVPDQTPLDRGAEELDVVSPEAEELMERSREMAEAAGVEVETHTVLSHEGFEQVYDAADRYKADVTVLGWSGRDRAGGRVGGTFDEVARSLPCDFVVYDDRDGEINQVLVAVGGGPDVALGGDVAAALQDVEGAAVRLLHVVDSPEDEDEGREFLEEWASERGLEDVEFVVDTSGDVQQALRAQAEDSDVVIVGAVGEGLLERLARGSLVLDVLYDVEASVVLTEVERGRSLREKLFGWRN